MEETTLTSLEPALEPYIPLGRSGLLPALHAAQKLYGWISEPVATHIARSLRIPLADVHGVIEFYSLFYNKPTSKHVIRVCTDAACALKNADDVMDHLCQQHGLQPGQTSNDLSLTIESSPCLGLCEHAPAALIDNDAETIIDVQNNSFQLGRPSSNVYGTIRMLTSNCGNGTTSLARYGKYSAFTKAIGMKPEEIVEEIKASGLVGRGGAAFPTGVKWEGAQKAKADQKYIICNADESEPGTFKDRVLLLDDPHRVVEGMLIAGYAVGASKGYIYVRGEYPYIIPVLEKALNEATEAGLLGTNILGTRFSFEIEIRVGAGAYICGEETALFESIEGKRGFPRIKPPFPTTHGVFGKPTVINNVESLCNVPLIIAKGAVEYRSIGTDKSPGPKLFCLSGDVERPGLYEVPFGTTLRELLDLAGGVSGGGELQTVLFGGAAGAFATPDQLDVKLTFEDLRAAGLPLGSGVVMVFDESRDLRKTLHGLGRFFAHESCGKCYPCQMGTQRQMEILKRIEEGKVEEGDFIRLQDVGWTMTDASLCGLGQTAASAVLSAMKLWPDMFNGGYKFDAPNPKSVKKKINSEKKSNNKPKTKITKKATSKKSSKTTVPNKKPKTTKTTASKKKTTKSAKTKKSTKPTTTKKG